MTLSPLRIVWFCGLMMSLSAFSIDISLPLFGTMASALDTPIDRLPLSITFYMLFLGFGQFIFGCLSDRYGRRVLLFIGMTVYILGAAAAAISDALSTLLLARAVQGLGAAGPYIISRAIIRDLYQGTELAQKMAIAMGIFSIGPILSPLIGAAILVLGGHWRWVFVIMAIYCAGMLITILFIPETIESRNPNATTFKTLVRNSKTVFFNSTSRVHMATIAITTISMILIISTIASVYANAFNISGAPFAIYYAVHGIGIILGQIANHKLIGIIGIERTTIIATIVMITSSLGIATIAMTSLISPWAISFCITVFALGYLSVIANSTSLLLQIHGNIIGFTAALQGTVSMIVSGVVSSVLALFVQNNVMIWGLAIAAPPTIVLLLLQRQKS